MNDVIIGSWTDYEDSRLITPMDFAVEVQNGTHWTLDQYCGGRVNTNLRWFNFDPFTGEKISRKAVKEYVKEYLKRKVNKA